MSADQPARDKSTRRYDVGMLLREQDKGSLAGSLGRFLKGAGVCLLVCFILAIVLRVVVGWSWFGWFIAFVVVLGALLAWSQRGPVTVDLSKVRQGGNGSSAGGGSTSLILGAPRGAVEGLRGMRGRWAPQQHAMFDRAALLVLDLAKTDGGVPVKEVLHPPEDMQTFGSAVDWLDANDWVGQATGGGSLWLSTVGRKRLVEKKLMPPPGDFEIVR